MVAACAGGVARRGDYHVLYRVDDASKIVEVARVAHRRDVYRRGVNG
ncbi:MAG: hypothetical protein E6I33_10975 [Chloroflexi bacterium]|nr:MAG: hypothetical protein E6I33_10975 [Chloroflexota bacterium]